MNHVPVINIDAQMEFFHAETYEDARSLVQRLRDTSDDPTRIYKIVGSPYEGFDIVSIDSELYADMLLYHSDSGLLPVRQLGNLRLADHAK